MSPGAVRYCNRMDRIRELKEADAVSAKLTGKPRFVVTESVNNTQVLYDQKTRKYHPICGRVGYSAEAVRTVDRYIDGIYDAEAREEEALAAAEAVTAKLRGLDGTFDNSYTNMREFYEHGVLKHTRPRAGCDGLFYAVFGTYPEPPFEPPR